MPTCLRVAIAARYCAALLALLGACLPATAATDPGEARIRAGYAGLPVAAALAEQPDRIARAVGALPAHAAAPETAVLAIGGSGFQEIFDREARRAAAVLAARGGGPALVLSNSPEQVRSGLVSSPRTVGLALAALGHRARPGDTLVVYLASHGSPEATIAMDAPRLDFEDLSASDLAQKLQRARISRRIIIVSACFGASWIRPLASPTTIMITAAAADRTSFGCDDSRELTVFGAAMLAELARPGASLAQAFARAKIRIAAEERAEHETPSRPQAWVGRDMAKAWAAR